MYEDFESWLDDCPLNKSRMKAGLTWYDLARRSQMAEGTLIKWADGSISRPRLENVAAVAFVLGDVDFFRDFYNWIERRPARELMAV